jgi:putative peptide zinc metalloprotease protein
VPGNLFSPYWYRVAELRPSLRSHARIHRHHYRGQLWYLLQDVSTGRHHRFTPATYYLLALMDGNRTVGEIWDAATTHLGDDAPTQNETIQLLTQLHAADVLRCDVTPDGLELFERFTRHQRAGWMRRLTSPLFVRLPLFDPDALLERALPFASPIFSRLGLALWLGVIAAGLLLAGMSWRALSGSDPSQVLDPYGLLLMTLTYAVVKAIHEFGHAFATKVWGGEVHEMGIMFLVFVPVPYVDASAAWSFGDKRRRMLVGAAGVMVEPFLASLALGVWLNVEPGLVRTVAYDVMLIGGVSTLFFNGNPLLRFDGYYVLSDALEIPNLGQRANTHLAYLFQHYVLGLEERRHRPIAPGERTWFVVYGLLAFAYRLAITFAIAVFVAGKLFFIGVLLAVSSVTFQIGLPAVRGLRQLFLKDPRFRRNRTRVLQRLALVGVGAAALLFVPVPVYTVTEGVVWLPEQSQVRAGADGFVRSILVPPDAVVDRGQPLIETHDPLLEARVKVLESRLRELRTEYHTRQQQNLVEAEIVQEEMETLEADLRRAREQADEATIRSPSVGRFVVPRVSDLPGRFVARGQVIAYVANLSQPTVRTVVAQADVARIRDRTRSVEVRLVDRVGDVIPAEIRSEVPAATTELPSMALGSAGGGGLAVDARDAAGLTAIDKLFQFDLALPAETPVAGIGGRVYVRFAHAPESVAAQLYRGVRRLFLGNLGV